MPQRFRRPWQSALLVLLTNAIFGVDAYTLLDTAIAVMYVVVILLAAAIWPPASLLLFGGICMLLTLTACFFSHGPHVYPSRRA